MPQCSPCAVPWCVALARTVPPSVYCVVHADHPSDRTVQSPSEIEDVHYDEDDDDSDDSKGPEDFGGSDF